MPFIDEQEVIKNIAVKAQAINADVIPAFGHIGNSELIIGRVVDLFNNSGSGMVEPVKNYQYRVYPRIFGIAGMQAYKHIHTVG